MCYVTVNIGCSRDKFRAMHPWERVRVAQSNKLCFNCLLPKHMAKDYKKPSSCSVPDCGKKHTKFLHTDPRPRSPSKGANSETRGATGNGNANDATGNVVNLGSMSAFGSTVYMPIVPIVVNGKSVLGLMVSGATNTVISQNLAKELCLSGQSHRYVLNTVSRSDVKSSLCLNVNVSSVDRTFSEQLKNVLVCSPLPARYPQSVIDISQYPHLSDIPIPQVGPGDRFDMIIGMDNGHLLFPLESRRNPEAPREPFAVHYVFGWCLNGIIGDSLSPEVQSCFLQVEPSVDNL